MKRNKCLDYIDEMYNIPIKKCSKLFLYDTDEKSDRDEKILSLYKEGVLSKNIANFLNIKQNAVQNVIQKEGIKRHWWKYKINDDGILNEESPFKYYILGLFATDKYIRNRDSKFIELTLNEKDRILMEDINKNLGNTKPPFLDENGFLKLILCSFKLYDILESYGICRNKYFNFKIEKNIPNKYLIHFLRGCFDGSGSIVGENTADIALCSSPSKKFAKQISRFYEQLGFNIYSYSSYSKNGKNDLYFVKKFGSEGLKILANLYSKSGPFMPRKYLKFLEFSRLSVDEIMMEAAHNFAQRSTCLRRKVGCIITNKEKTNIISIGYNGTPAGETNHCESSVPGKCGCIHAEQNAFLKGNGPILYSTTIPCKNCAKLIVNAGVKEVYYDADYRESYTFELFNRANIIYKKIARSEYEWKMDIAKILEWNGKNDS